MRRLILFRHAKAEARSAGGEDIDRGLIERGRSDAARIGDRLARAGMAPDIALVSSAARALQTWNCVRDVFPDATVEIDEELYNATAEELEAELGLVAGRADTVMIVGHNPGLQELAIALLEQSDASHAAIEGVSSGFPTATAAVFRIDETGRASVERLLKARDPHEADA
jgi:phosphohistidine phosphatase